MRPLTLNPPFVEADYEALIDSRQFTFAEAFTVLLNDDRQYYWTDKQQSFTAPPCDGSSMRRTYNAGQVLVTGFRFKCSNGQERNGSSPAVSMEVDEQSVTFTPYPGYEIDDLPFLTAVASGSLDGAYIHRDRWFFNAAGVPVAGMPMFYGLTADIDSLSRTQAVIKCKSALVLLNILMPKNLYQTPCIWTVYDAGCGLSKAAFSTTGVCGAGSTDIVINWSGATTAYSLGTITFEDGPNVGLTRTIRTATGSQLLLAYPLPYPPGTGDQFSAAIGCNRTLATCIATFDNEANFRGYPFVPTSETAF